jgi:hypothetical protein
MRAGRRDHPHHGTQTACWTTPAAVGRHFAGALQRELAAQLASGAVKDIRGRGLMIGIELAVPCGALMQQCLDAGPADQRDRRQRGAPGAAADRDSTPRRTTWSPSWCP